MASIRHWFTLICINQTLPTCNVHQMMSEWRGQCRLTLFDVCLTWIDAQSIINRRFGRTQSLQTVSIVDLHRFTLTSCLTLNRPNLGLNQRKSMFGWDWDRPGLTGCWSGVDRHRFALIKIDLGIINVDLLYYTLINPNQLISRYFYAI